MRNVKIAVTRGIAILGMVGLAFANGCGMTAAPVGATSAVWMTMMEVRSE